MGFQIGKHIQPKYPLQLEGDVAGILLSLLEAKLERPEKIGMQDRIMTSIESELYNMLAASINRHQKKDSIKIKLLFHQAVALMQICNDVTEKIHYSYKLQLEQLAFKIDKQL